MSARENGWYWLTDDFGNHLLCRWLSADRKLVMARFDYREGAMPHVASELSPVTTPAEVAALRAENAAIKAEAAECAAELAAYTRDLRAMAAVLTKGGEDFAALKREVERLRGALHKIATSDLLDQRADIRLQGYARAALAHKESGDEG